MAEFDDKLNAILSNPDVMNQIMSIAGSMSQQQSTPAPEQQNPVSPLGINPAAMQGMMELIQNSQIDPKQRTLIQALRGYLPPDRINKLERAMQAARIAKYASANLGGRFSSGR